MEDWSRRRRRKRRRKKSRASLPRLRIRNLWHKTQPPELRWRLAHSAFATHGRGRGIDAGTVAQLQFCRQHCTSIYALPFRPARHGYSSSHLTRSATGTSASNHPNSKINSSSRNSSSTSSSNSSDSSGGSSSSRIVITSCWFSAGSPSRGGDVTVYA